jgi:hypothetical protein
MCYVLPSARLTKHNNCLDSDLSILHSIMLASLCRSLNAA